MRNTGLPVGCSPSGMPHTQYMLFFFILGRFEEILLSVSRLLSPECLPTLLASRDGSGRGAAMVTAVALRLAAQRREVEEVLGPLRLTRADLEKVQALMREEMEQGLGKETNPTASVRMLPTYVCRTPDGTGKGQGHWEWGAEGTVALLMQCAGSPQREATSWRWTWGGPTSVCWWCA